ncbi:MAG: T9SS type A sorting domain-containing protein [Saprospiraceae bacterium]
MYTWSLSGTGELAFTFDPIALPDSGANFAASQGFVQFRIAQRPNLPQNTRFENQAAIYFDFNAPVLTKTVFHTIRPLFTGISSVEPPVFAEGEMLKIWPNPASTVAYISFREAVSLRRKVALYDVNGRLVAVTFTSDQTVAMQRNGLPAGAYWLHVSEHGGRTKGGIVVFR